MPLPDFFNPERRSLQRLKAGDLEGLRWIYDQYAGRLLNQCHRILLSREQAEDVVQDLFIKLPEAVTEFRGESALGTWLYRVAHNMCLTRLQQAGNRQRLLEENLSGEGGEGRDAYEVSDLLAKALAVLDPETRSLLWLKEGEGLPLKELSETFKLPEGTLKSRLSRARDRVREFLEKEERVGKAG
jgi:RNA polymerase sigma-70 factor (ECF subfamily)